MDVYEKEQLSAYPFFGELLRSSGLASLHDSLTGLIARPCILGLLRELISRSTPFSLAIMDLDNFKNVNDRFGHQTGDLLLAHVAGALRAYVGDAGLVGRFGGDEFLIVNLRDTDYDSVHTFFDGMYDGTSVLRRTVELPGASVYVTATVGCACFPTDAADYDALFQLADKTLYRGKAKGRNCFILYVPAKHRNIQIRSLAGSSLCETFRAMAESFDGCRDALEKLRRAFAPMRQTFFLQRLWWLSGRGELLDVEDGAVLHSASAFPTALLADGMLALTGPEELERLPAGLCTALREAGMDSVLLVRVGREQERLGCLVFCPEARTLRVWQDKECATAFILSRMLAQELRTRNKDDENKA